MPASLLMTACCTCCRMQWAMHRCDFSAVVITIKGQELIYDLMQVRIYSYNPQGAVSVRFKTPEAAGECVTKMKGRFFGGRQLDAFRWDGITNYMVKKPKAQADEEDQARLDAYASSLEQGTG